MENIHNFAFLLVGEDGEMVLVDSGFSPSFIPGLKTAFMRGPEHEIPAAIENLGFDPSQVKQVIMTHLHWDHTAAMQAFAGADFFIQANEFRGLLQLNPNEETYYCPGDWLDLLPRINLIEGDYELRPGIKLIHSGGHTRGHQLVEVQTKSGTVILAGDVPVNYDTFWKMISPEGWKAFREGPGARFYWHENILPTIRAWLEEQNKLAPVSGPIVSWKEIKKSGARLLTSHDPRNLNIHCID